MIVHRAALMGGPVCKATTDRFGRRPKISATGVMVTCPDCQPQAQMIVGLCANCGRGYTIHPVSKLCANCASEG